MTTSAIPNLPTSLNAAPQQSSNSYQCALQWRRGQLLVKPAGHIKQPYLPALDDEQKLVECLTKSPVQLVRIAPELGYAHLWRWANVCKIANKQVFLQTPASGKQPKLHPVLQGLSWLINSLIASLLLIVASPIVAALVILMRLYSPGEILAREWYVGKRGQLFQAFRFRTYEVNHQDNTVVMTVLGGWMSKFKLEKLPQLVNVLRGEMTILGPSARSLAAAAHLSHHQQPELNALPGVTESLQVETQAKLLELDSQVL